MAPRRSAPPPVVVPQFIPPPPSFPPSPSAPCPSPPQAPSPPSAGHPQRGARGHGADPLPPHSGTKRLNYAGLCRGVPGDPQSDPHIAVEKRLICPLDHRQSHPPAPRPARCGRQALTLRPHTLSLRGPPHPTLLCPAAAALRCHPVPSSCAHHVLRCVVRCSSFASPRDGYRIPSRQEGGPGSSGSTSKSG